ncbi:hypothetical protein PRIPAC_85971 [Pristionchus pacificus]|uniref:Uncharacterized protein n=1 Tax=Pristionchus pacificus TaxID=54126 RepID=A0A2A6BSG5_PRIPA|nr:hypothetical protein PRIPAC_85971 [Pristionchus pacificus]|eukprot:PDM68879.1 hypothetical protein PRIPAC_47181 [Pristionchus pacificus]
MDTSTSSGQWMNIPCTEKLPIACIRDRMFITSPGFPYNASIPCDFFLIVDEGKKVDVEANWRDWQFDLYGNIEHNESYLGAEWRPLISCSCPDGFQLVAAGECRKLKPITQNIADDQAIDTILVLEANTCCDHLVIHENYFGSNIIANLTGELSNKFYTTNSSNSMRVSWQPTDGVNVKGVMMTFKSV